MTDTEELLRRTLERHAQRAPNPAHLSTLVRSKYRRGWTWRLPTAVVAVTSVVVLGIVWLDTRSATVDSGPVAPKVSTVLHCESRMRSFGSVDHIIPTEPNTEAPVDQAQRYLEGMSARQEDYSDLSVVLGDDGPNSQTMVIVGDGKAVALLRYDYNELLGWHLATTQACTPPQAPRFVSVGLDRSLTSLPPRVFTGESRSVPTRLHCLGSTVPTIAYLDVRQGYESLRAAAKAERIGGGVSVAARTGQSEAVILTLDDRDRLLSRMTVELQGGRWWPQRRVFCSDG